MSDIKKVIIDKKKIEDNSGLNNKKVTSISELISIKPKKFENNLANIFIKNINNI